MTPAFWDASALVPLCVQQESSAELFRLTELYSIVVWWATPVEMCSAFERLLSMGQLTGLKYAVAILRLTSFGAVGANFSPVKRFEWRQNEC